MQMSDMAVSAWHMTKRFGSETAPRNVSMELEHGKSMASSDATAAV